MRLYALLTCVCVARSLQKANSPLLQFLAIKSALCLLPVSRLRLTLDQGDRFEINVVNLLHDGTMNQSTTIVCKPCLKNLRKLTRHNQHWHGLTEHGTVFADGVSMISQCPISANHSFLYSFQPHQTGSYWYHSHVGTQYCDGLRGALILYDGENGCNDPHRSLYDVDDGEPALPSHRTVPDC